MRKVQAEGLQADCNQNEEFALKIRLLPALAYASPFDVPELFADVVKQLPMPAAQGLVLYFERTYIRRTLPGGTFFFTTLKYPKDFQKQQIMLKHGTVLTMLLSVAIIQTYGNSLLF